MTNNLIEPQESVPPVPPGLENGGPTTRVTDQDQPPVEAAGESLRRFLFDVFETILISLVLFWGVNLISARIRVDGYSMEPTFQDGQLVIVNKLAYKFAEPMRGDVIIFYYPRNPDEEFIKRIIGLPGDVVEIKAGQVSVNGAILTEPYIAAPPAYEYRQVVPESTLFVLGDNRNNSSDSHSWGPLPMDLVVGKAIFVYWPLPNAGVVQHPTLQAQ